jgi:alpha-tubulin suppressor-like RCC1 family protein
LAIAAGAAHTCALTAGGGVKCWGFNSQGQIGNGTINDALSAVDATGMTTGVAAITAAYDHSCALTTVGGIKCWGNNGWGQLGTGDTTDHRTAVDVAGIASGAVAVTAGGSVEWVGGSHTCALVVGGGVKCWGANEFGQLGNGNTANAYAPVDVAGLIAGATTVSAGTNHTCAVTTGGAVKCWGSNRGGQLGNGIAGYFTTAQNVLTVAQNGIPIATTEVPALSVWGLWLLSLVLGGAAMRTIAPWRH